MKSLNRTNPSISVELPHNQFAGLYNRGKSQEEIFKSECRECESLIEQIKRHTDCGHVQVVYESEEVCGHCGATWSEEGEQFNGGCCDEDWQGAPWQEYQDSGEICSKCSRPPYRWFEHDGTTYYDCKCGHEW